MTPSDDRTAARRLLHGLEYGDLPLSDLAVLVEQLDPVLVYVVFSYLRAVHPAGDPAASAILERVVRLTSGSAVAVAKNREGARDPVSRWLESEHEYRRFKGRETELVDLVADKLDS